MIGLICDERTDESALIEFTLQRAGHAIRTTRSLDPIIESWTHQFADFVIIVLSGSIEKYYHKIQTLRSIAFAPMILIVDPQQEDLLIRFYEIGIDLIIIRPYSLNLLPHQLRPLLLRNDSMPLHGLPVLSHPQIRLDPRSRSAVVEAGAPVHLTQLEFRLLYTLMIHSDQVLPTDEIVTQVWGYSGEENRELVRGLVQRLRAKIEPDPQSPRYILTEPGVGYRLAVAISE
jgi:DNA-binding response OmpR family regulator